VIPGNEKSIARLVNHLLRRGAEVVTAADAPIHVSGHPCAEELRTLLRLLRPRFLIPIHGEYRQLRAHARLGREAGLPSERVIVAESGDVVALDGSAGSVVDRVAAGQVFIDAALEEVDTAVLRDRRHLAGDGIVVPVVAIHRASGAVNGTPEVVSRGFLSETDQDEILREAGSVVALALSDASHDERSDEALLKARIQSGLKRYFRKRTQRRPLIIPVIVEL
jgi:ribonuclease J